MGLCLYKPSMGKSTFEGVFMNFRKGVLVAFVVLIVASSVLYAQGNTNLGTGVYRTTGTGTNLIEVRGRSGLSTRDITLFSPDGSEVIYRGTGTWRNGSFQVDFGRDGFDIWTIVSAQEFIDGSGRTWRWVRQSL